MTPHFGVRSIRGVLVKLARLNYSTNSVSVSDAPFLAHSASSIAKLPEFQGVGSTQSMNLCTAINSALRCALETDESAIILGEDVVFGGVFRCTKDLHSQFGGDRVFNTPLSEQGLVGFAIGYAAMNKTAIAEIQFADYVFPAFDQIVNEATKYRYRGGDGFNAGGLTIRMPCSVVGHGGLYHSQSGEAFFSHSPGIRVVMPRSPAQAKGLLLSCIRSQDPCLFMEPKILYRASVEHVPLGDYELPLDKAEILRQGTDITLVGYGTQIYTLMQVAELAAKDGISCEVIDLRTVVPWDRETVVNSVIKTGKCVVTHEAPRTNGIGAEVAAEVQRLAFLNLEAPIARVTGWDVPNSLAFEQFQIPDVTRVLDTVKTTVNY